MAIVKLFDHCVGLFRIGSDLCCVSEVHEKNIFILKRFVTEIIL